MEFFKTLIHGNVLDTCPICLENIREKQTHVLHLCTFKTPTFTCATNNSLIFLFYLTFS